MRHVSPTAAELSAAESNGATPSLAVDVVRSVEFLTPRWAKAVLSYPNFFDAPSTNIADVRAWLKNISTTEWNSIIAKEATLPLSGKDAGLNTAIGAGTLPASPIDWNTLISDDVILQAIQARRWLTPNVTEKYKTLIETNLSYSHTYAGDPLKNPPKLPDLSNGYDIAYLGLTPFVPGGGKDPNSEDIQAYQYKIWELQGLNFADERDPALDDPQSRSTAQCGPPEWVNLFQWPAAIMCWMKSLLPVRITAGSCGGNSIGLSSPSPSTSPPATIFRDSTKLADYYKGSRLVYSIDRSSIERYGTLEIDYTLNRDGATVIPPSSALVRLDIVSIESQNQTISRDNYGWYATLATSEAPYGERWSSFLLSSYDNLGVVTVKPTLAITLPDDTVLQIVGDPLKIKITDEYIDMSPTIGDDIVSSVATIENRPVNITFTPRKWSSGDILPQAWPYRIDIYDDATSTLIQSGITSATSPYTLPAVYMNDIGVYRFIATDADGRTGETTLAVRSGPVARMEFTPISSTLAKGANSLWVLRLLDQKWNPISPSLLNLKVTAIWWYLLDISGNKKSSLTFDSIDSEFIFNYGKDDAGDMSLRFDIADPAISITEIIKVIEQPRIKIFRAVPPKVSGDPVDMQIQVVDAVTDLPVSGFSSLAFLDIPEWAGIFSGSELRIKDGQSEPFTFIPGKKSGDHLLAITIPGVSNISEKKFNVLPGPAMYIDGNITDTTIDFTLRDRYGNLADGTSMLGTLKKNQDPPTSITFVNGKSSLPRSSGYWRVDVPAILANVINYTDIENIQTATWVISQNVTKTLQWISFYNLYVNDVVGKYTFLPDYNARYTVLAGDSFLKEGSQILYDTTPGASQSLAVSTLLSTPYFQDTLFSIFPGWWWAVWQPSDMAIETTLSARWAFLRLEIADSASHSNIAQVAYPLTGLPFSSCTESGAETNICKLPTENGGITFALFPESEYRLESGGESVSIIENTTPLISYTKSTGLFLAPGITLLARPDYSFGRLVADIQYSGESIGRLILGLAESDGVDIAPTNNPVTKLTLDSDHAYSRSNAYSSVFSPSTRWYSIYRDSDDIVLDERVIGPNHIGNFGALRESPGVWWQENNRTLLSFAAGDSVWEATRWFQTYNLINLWDPVIHVDKWAPGTEFEGLDRSIGTQIAGGNERGIEDYKYRDMNADGLQDIIVIYNDGFLELYLNLWGVFRKKQKIAYLPEISARWVDFWDFVWDQYADILSLDHSGSLVLVDNSSRRLTEKIISLSDGSPPPQKVTQYKIFDMDNDRLDDIVYLTEWGELGILYGTVNPWVFNKNILDGNLGVALSEDGEKAGGAIRANVIPLALPVSAGTGTDAGVLNDEVYYQRRVNPTPADAAMSVDASIPGGISIPVDLNQPNTVVMKYFPDPNTPTVSPIPIPATPTNPNPSLNPDLYVRSEYAPAYGLEIEKKYRNITSSTLHGGDRILVEITIKNTTASAIKNVEYLDSLPKIFDLPDDPKYQVILWWQNREYPLGTISAEEYDFYLKGVDIPSGDTLTFRYELTALTASYGDMIVDHLEWGLIWDDAYGDVGFETSNTCGAEMILWSSTAVRTYIRGTRGFSPAELPPSLASKLQDANGNGVPDSVDTMTVTWSTALKDAYNSMWNQTSLSQGSLVQTTSDPSWSVISIWLSPQAEQEIESTIQNLADGLACGFGGGWCLSMPINWAPLAPGGSLSVLGMPVNIAGMAPSIGLPIFSGLTGMPMYCGYSPCCIPSVYPGTPLGYVPWPVCWAPSAGGSLGTWSPFNTFRIYVTPTLTLGMGAAMCFWGTSMVSGRNPLFPLIPYGNCIVVTKSLPICKWDGSSDDGSVAGISGLGSTTDAWNSSSCKMKAVTLTKAENTVLTQDIIRHLKNPQTSTLNSIYSSISRRWSRGGDLWGPVVRIGDGWGGAGTIDIGLDTSKPFTMNNIIKVNNKRISGFPEFIMDWVSRQTDEFTNKFLTLPNIVIIPPRSFGQNAVVDGSYSDFLSKFSEKSIKDGYKNLQDQVGAAGNVNVTDNFNKWTKSTNAIGQKYDAFLDNAVKSNASTINSVAGGANQVKAVYQFLWQLPFLRVERASVPINIPWILPQEFDRYSRAMAQYKNEINNAKKWWCDGKPNSKECLDSKTNIWLGALSSSIEQNLRRIDEWRKFPEKIQKYITWKQRYMTQILCNVEALEKMLGWWYRDNGKRFMKWAEFYVLMKTIVATWQPFLDLWREKDRSCSVCQNQRWDLKYWKFKLLSAVIPSFPILQFPRWPDIVLDLSDIRFGILIRMPEFQFNITPIRLPDLPSLGLPGLPSLSLSLPGLPTIPAPPSLPDLPDLPSLPNINLPNLPPPPKLPKLFGAVLVALNIFKLYIKIQCFMEKTVLIPEDNVWATIAQRTDRQMTLPFDFLKVSFPQISIPGIREIRVSTHVNFELKSDFMVEFAKNAVKPINRLNADFSKVPTKIGPDLKIGTPPNINVKLPYISPTKKYISLDSEDIGQTIASLESLSGEMMEIDSFIPYFRQQLVLAWLDATELDRSLALSRKESIAVTTKMQKNTEKGFQFFHKYIKEEQAKTHELEKMLDNMKNPPKLMVDRAIPLAQYVSDPVDRGADALDTYQSWQQETQSSFAESLKKPIIPDRKLVSLQWQLHRLLAASGPLPATSTPGTTVGYSPLYEGIFVLSPLTKKQTRLFDYTDWLSTEDKVSIVDIDKDSTIDLDGDGIKDNDRDYIFLLDGALYVKYNTLASPNRPVDTTPPVISSPDLTLVPRAPDFFHESVASPGQMELSFAPANPADTSFRLEFFDKYLEWDRNQLAGNDDPNTPRVVIDLTTTSFPTLTENYSVTPVNRVLEDVSSPEWFFLEGMKVSTLLTWQEFSLSAGRALYTGNSVASLKFSTNNEWEKIISLDKFQRYTFTGTLVGSVVSGKAYVLTPAWSEKISYSDDMRGMPLLPDTRIYHPNGSVVIFDPITNRSDALLPNTEYRHLDLGKISSRYDINFSFPNGFYSTRLRSLIDDRMIRAGVTLIAPQASLDRSSPVINVGTVRIPVYKTSSLLKEDIITDMSPYSVSIDPDVTLDSDGNGVYEDDFITSGSGVDITATDIIFGKYDTLGKRMVNMRVVDDYGNETVESLEIEVYAPIPKIETASSTGNLFGLLDEEISAEPIHLFRVREGEGIALIDPNPFMTMDAGDFSGSNINSGSGIRLDYLNGNALLSDKTGLPYNAANIGTSFQPATATGTMQIRFSDNNGKLQFLYEILPPPDIKIVTVAPANPWNSPFLLVSPTSGSTVITANLSDPSIPWGIYLVGPDARAIIAVDKYAQIYSLHPDIELSVWEKDGYLQIRAVRTWSVVGEFLYHVNFFFTGK